MRNTGGGRFAYAIYKGRVARRGFKPGRPHYDLVAGITLGSGDVQKTREIQATSQLGRILLGNQ